jgi:hypothetical protein
MSGVESRDFSSPDETRTPPNATVELVNVGGGQVGRYTFKPGWRWSTDIKPIAKTDTCQVEHIGYVVSGSMRARHIDGSEIHMVPGMVYHIRPSHDGWNDSSEPCVVVEFQGAATFAKG